MKLTLYYMKMKNTNYYFLIIYLFSLSTTTNAQITLNSDKYANEFSCMNKWWQLSQLNHNLVSTQLSSKEVIIFVDNYYLLLDSSFQFTNITSGIANDFSIENRCNCNTSTIKSSFLPIKLAFNINEKSYLISRDNKCFQILFEKKVFKKVNCKFDKWLLWAEFKTHLNNENQTFVAFEIGKTANFTAICFLSGLKYMVYYFDNSLKNPLEHKPHVYVDDFQNYAPLVLDLHHQLIKYKLNISSAISYNETTLLFANASDFINITKNYLDNRYTITRHRLKKITRYTCSIKKRSFKAALIIFELVMCGPIFLLLISYGIMRTFFWRPDEHTECCACCRWCCGCYCCCRTRPLNIV